MIKAEYNKYLSWYLVLEQIMKEYPSDLSLDTTFKKIKLKLNEYK